MRHEKQVNTFTTDSDGWILVGEWGEGARDTNTGSGNDINRGDNISSSQAELDKQDAPDKKDDKPSPPESTDNK